MDYFLVDSLRLNNKTMCSVIPKRGHGLCPGNLKTLDKMRYWVRLDTFCISSAEERLIISTGLCFPQIYKEVVSFKLDLHVGKCVKSSFISWLSQRNSLHLKALIMSNILVIIWSLPWNNKFKSDKCWVYIAFLCV